MKFVRNFVAVGQGGFTIEKFYNNQKMEFCAIYDCGSISVKEKCIYKTINEHFNYDDKINALFISHFDQDHVSGIPYLLKNYEVENIYLPVLSKQQKIILCLDRSDKKTISLIKDPVKYISKIINKKNQKNKINIIFILQEENDGINEENNKIYVENENINVDYKKSGEPIKLGNYINSFWEYTPHNISYSAYNDLEREIKKKYNKLKIDDILKDKIKCDDIKKIYIEAFEKKSNKIVGKGDQNQLNLNSLILYSGYKNDECSIYAKHTFYFNSLNRLFKYGDYWCDRYCKYHYIEYNNPGCLYLGDSNATSKEVKYLLKKYEDRISCLQMPHHGSKHNNDDVILNMNKFFIIFAGVTNGYNHPSAIIIEKLNIYNKLYHIVTENRDTELFVIYQD